MTSILVLLVLLLPFVSAQVTTLHPFPSYITLILLLSHHQPIPVLLPLKQSSPPSPSPPLSPWAQIGNSVLSPPQSTSPQHFPSPRLQIKLIRLLPMEPPLPPPLLLPLLKIYPPLLQTSQEVVVQVAHHSLVQLVSMVNLVLTMAILPPLYHSSGTLSYSVWVESLLAGC